MSFVASATPPGQVALLLYSLWLTSSRQSVAVSSPNDRIMLIASRLVVLMI